MTKWQRTGCVFGILILASFLRFYHFTTTPPGLYPDEAADGNNAVEALETGHFQTFYVEDNGREGMYINLIAVVLKVFPVYEPWVIRLPAAIAGVLTVLGIYFLAAELFGYSTGLFASFLLATSFWHINFSRIGFRAIFAPLLLCWALYFLLKAFKSSRDGIAAWYAIAAGIIYALGFYTYIAYRITPLLCLIFIPFFWGKQGFWKRVAIFTAVTFIVAAPIGWHFVNHPADFFGRTSQIAITKSESPARDFVMNLWTTLLMLNVNGDSNFRHNISRAPELSAFAGIFFLTGTVLTVRRLLVHRRDENNQKNTFGSLLILLWFLLAILPAAASNDGVPHALRAILMLPPTMIFAAIAGVWLYESAYRLCVPDLSVRPIQATALLIVLTIAFSGYHDYFVVWAENPNVPFAFNADYVAMAREINELPRTMPKYVVVVAKGTLDRGIPVPAHTVMFLTHSFTEADRAAANIRYLVPSQVSRIPAGTPNNQIFSLR
ncbi:MAG TPA: glycosyltransferase family 39 protein [Terriglobales bacterium]|nr:glycosyltransferase family 39 protein [Terriglobales bacterium]